MLQLETRDICNETPRKLSDFLATVSRANSRALLLDYDGTLAPFSEDRHRAVPYPEIPDLLDRIRNSTNTRLVIVTGRRAFEAASLLGLKKIEIWGCHGMSRIHPDGRYELPNLDEESVSKIFEASKLLREEGLFDLLEFKPAAIAVHWRGMESSAGELARRVEKAWGMLRDRRGIELRHFDGGMEIRVASGNKGDAVRTILAEMGPKSAVAYLGDDQTDEDAFAALQGHGLGALVRNEYRPTGANVWLRPPEGVLGFLADWAAACGGAS